MSDANGGQNGGQNGGKPPAKKVPQVEFVIEFGDAQNCSFRWAFDDRVVRGWWKRSNHKRGEPSEFMADMPDIPGLRFRLSSASGTAEIRDPLKEEKNARLLERIKVAYRKIEKQDGRPEEPVVYKNLTADEIKTLCWNVRRMLDNRQCELLSGKIPTVEELREFPGQIMTGSFDMGPEGKKLGEIPNRYHPPYHPDPQEA